MNLANRMEDDRFYGRALKILVVLLALAIFGFAAYYYLDRYHAAGTSPVDQETARLEQMVVNDPANPATRVALAGLYVKKKLYGPAITQYQEALRLDDQHQGALIGMGMAYYEAGKTKEAQAAFERIVEMSQDDGPRERTALLGGIHYFLGKIYAANGDLLRAESELKLALGVNRGDADTIYELAQVQALLGRNEDAIQLFEVAVSMVPDYAEAYAGLAKAYAAAGRTVEADYATAMLDLWRGNYDTAITRLTAVVQAKPELAGAYFGLGAAYNQKNDHVKAAEYYGQALHYDPKHAAAGAALGRLRLGMPAANPTPAGGR